MKGLEALKIILKHNGVFYGKDILQDYEELKEATKSVEKELKALEILSKYNLHITLRPFLTEEEFNLIKEISQND